MYFESFDDVFFIHYYLLSDIDENWPYINPAKPTQEYNLIDFSRPSMFLDKDDPDWCFYILGDMNDVGIVDGIQCAYICVREYPTPSASIHASVIQPAILPSNEYYTDR